MTSHFITPLYPSEQGPTITGKRIKAAGMTYPAGTEGKLPVHPNEQIQAPSRVESAVCWKSRAWRRRGRSS
jgi:hypothetical protein